MPSNKKIDLYKVHRDDYATPKEPVLLTVKPARYLAIEGRGEPGGERFQAEVGALYACAYAIKMDSKEAGRDYTVCKLEVTWRIPGHEGEDGSQVPREQWRWKMLIRTPDFVRRTDLAAAAQKVRAKGKLSDIDRVGLEKTGPVRCVQMLHVGPYENEGETLQKMRRFAAKQDLCLSGEHHEIYLSDPRRVAPARLKTILRLPVR